MSRKEPKPPSVELHAFARDPEVPADPYSGLEVCRCGKPGRAGDDQHPVDGPPLVAVFAETAQVLPPKPDEDRSDDMIGEGRDV